MREDLETNGLARDMIYDRALWHHLDLCNQPHLVGGEGLVVGDVEVALIQVHTETIHPQ